MIQKDNIYKDMCELIRVPSISGTEQEKLGAFKVMDILKEIKYFKEHPEHLKLIPVKNDPLDRHIPIAFLPAKEKTKKTVIITGHYDVVDIEEFGHLKPIAFDVEAITKRIQELPMDEYCKKDFESGDWIFGRGSADMKFGLALCIELLRHFSESNELSGNLLFVAVPGEETNSEGMLSAVSYLSKLEEEDGLELIALINTECYMPDNQAESKIHRIHLGASGKVMPFFFFTGAPTHAADAFEGFDSNFLACQFHNLFHLNSDFCDVSKGEVTPPPLGLKFGDLKDLYSVSIPLYTVAYYNLITLSLDPVQLIKKLRNLAEEAFGITLELHKKKVENYEKLVGKKILSLQVEPCVMTVSELYREAKAYYDGDLDAHVNSLIEKLQQERLEMQDICTKVVKEIYDIYPKKRPMIIIGFIPPYYPDVYPENNENTRNLVETMEFVIDYAKLKYNKDLEMKNYYMGICDMCYSGLSKDRNFDMLFENLVGIDQVYEFPQTELKKINIPSVVLGSYGKDSHKCTERLNYSYNFEILPDLYVKAIINLLKK